jgi:hypothetical protein
VVTAQTFVEALGEHHLAPRGEEEALADVGDRFRRWVGAEQGEGIHQLATGHPGEFVDQVTVAPEVDSTPVAGETKRFETGFADEDLVVLGDLHQPVVGGPEHDCTRGEQLPSWPR